jgi:tetratricopeptide (TPR) repeat protein
MLVGFAASSRTLRHALLFIYKLVVQHLKKTQMKRLTVIILLFSINTFAQNGNFEKWQELANKDINLQPEFGGAEKNESQIKADNDFIEEILKHYDNKQEASKKMTELGFQYLYERRDFQTAMKRFNQAYLLEPNNADIYYGYGTVYFNLDAMEKAREQFDKGLLKNPKHSKMLTDYGTTYLGDYYNSVNTDPKEAIEKLDNSVKYLEKSYSIDEKNSDTIYKLSIINMYLGNCKKANKYLEKADKMKNPNITEEFKAKLKQKCG